MTSTLTASDLRSLLPSALAQQYQIVPDADDFRLTTPLFLPDNTELQVYVRRSGDETFQVTDRGETYDWLFLSGIDLALVDRRIPSIALRFGVQIDTGVICKEADLSSLPAVVNQVVQAILDLAYLVYLR